MAEYATCPVCLATTELTPRRKQLKVHDQNGVRCRGSGEFPTFRGGQSFRKARLIRIGTALAGFITVAAAVTTILVFIGISPPKAEPRFIRIASSPRQLVSSTRNGQPANGSSGRPSFDSSGRYVAFTSNATNLSSSATNGEYNIYRKDRESGAIYLASRGLNGSPANGSSQFPTICRSGRYIAFALTATNLIQGKAHVNGKYYEVYVNDTLTGQTILVSETKAGIAANDDSRAPTFNAHCTKVVFESDARNLAPGPWNNSYNVYVKDLRTGSVVLASARSSGGFPNGDSTHAAINGAGTLVAFTSWAGDLPDGELGRPAIYLRDLRTGQITNISSAYANFCSDAKGFSWPNFSPDGDYLIFTSVDSTTNPNLRGKCVLVWNVDKQVSAITGATGQPVGWADACVTGINNGTTFAPIMSDATKMHPHLVLFTVTRKDGFCSMVLRDLNGNDIPIKSKVNLNQILEPNMNSSGDYLSWDVYSRRQQVYACKVDRCAEGI